jgi:hypothetical protein
MIQGVSDYGTGEHSLAVINHYGVLVHVEERLPVCKLVELKRNGQTIFVVLRYIGKPVLAIIAVNKLPHRMQTVEAWLVAILDRFVPGVIERIHLPVTPQIIVKPVYFRFKRKVIFNIGRGIYPSDLLFNNSSFNVGFERFNIFLSLEVGGSVPQRNMGIAFVYI